MEEKITKCPMCGTKLKMINGRMTCKDCGYYLRDTSETTESADSFGSGGSGSADSGGSTPADSARSGGYNFPGTNVRSDSYNFPGTNVRSGSVRTSDAADSSPRKPSGSKRRVKATMISLLTALVLGLSSGYVRSGIKNVIMTLSDSRDKKTDSSPSAPEPYSAVPPASDSFASSGSSARALPESDFAIAFIEAVYGKDYKLISAEEYAAVTALRVDEREHYVFYQLNNGEIQYMTYSDVSLDVSDLNCFSGLEQLYIEDTSLSPLDDLKELENLYTIHAKNSAKDIAKYVAHPENILDLGIYDWTWDNDLNDLSSFPNLIYLTVDYDHLTDISALKSYPGLLGLDLGECEELTDYSPLMSLTQLQELSISSPQLKTIDFIRQMPNLTCLCVEDSQIQDLSALSACPMLTDLQLEDNYKLDDYSEIGNLNNLTSLSLAVSQQASHPLPSFQELSQIRLLSLENVDDLSPLRDAVNVETLLLKHCGSGHLDALASMPYLSQLRIEDFWGLTSSLTALTQLPCLEVLNISGTNVFGNMEEIFSIPTLKYLYMDDCQVGLDFDAVAPSPNLETLSMCEVRILKDPSYNSGEKIYLSDHEEFFDNFPNLTELYVSSANLDNIDFVAKMPGLQYLDISNNNITSLSPLLGLEDFHAVWCGQNTILEALPEDSRIIVYTTSRED